MIDLNKIGFNTICPICGKELDRIEFMAEGRVGKYPYQTLKGFCPKCAFDVTINEGVSHIGSLQTMDILDEWNMVFKKNTKLITVNDVIDIVNKYAFNNSTIDHIDVVKNEELTIEAEKYCKDHGLRIVMVHEK